MKKSPFSLFWVLSGMLQQLPKPHPALLQDKLDLVSHSEQRSGQSRTGRTAKHVKAVGLRDVLWLLEQSLVRIKHTRSKSIILTVVQGITTVLLTVSPLQPELKITHRDENAKGSGKMQTQIMWSSLHISAHRGRKRRMQRLLPQLMGLTLIKFKGMCNGTGSYCSAQASTCLWSQQILLKHVISLRW